MHWGVFFPSSAPVIAKVGFGAIGANSLNMGAADIIEGTQDIYYGTTGNTETHSTNYVRDSLFGGNQEAYEIFELASAGASFGAGFYSSAMFTSPFLNSGSIGYYANIYSGLNENSIYMNGMPGEQALMEIYGGSSQVYYRTSLGGRYIDQLANGIAHESKLGYTTLTQRVKTQILKDVELLKTGQISGIHWHFFESVITGKKGASKELIEFLIEMGIEYTIH